MISNVTIPHISDKITKTLVNVYFMTNDQTNKIEDNIENSVMDLFNNDLFNEQYFEVTDDINNASCVLFMLSEHFSLNDFNQLRSLNDNVPKIGFIASGASNIYDFSLLKNVYLIAQTIETTYPPKKLKQVLKLGHHNKLIRLPISSFVSSDTLPSKSNKSFELDYQPYMHVLGFYEIMANSLGDGYSEILINCPSDKIAISLYNSLIYGKDQSQQFQNKVLIKSFNNSNSELETLKNHAMIKLIKIINHSLGR